MPNNLTPCEHLKEDYTCGSKCIACKLFTCDYLEKKGIKFKIKDILLLNVFFNLPPLDERENDLPALNDLLTKLGFTLQSDEKNVERRNKILGIF